MSPIDLGVIAVYIFGCIALGGWIGSGTRGLKGYFLGERNVPGWAVMISIVATETSTATFLSVPGVAYAGDMTYLQLPMGYLIGRVIVATVLLPAYFHGQIETAYQVLGHRFGEATRRAASLLFLLTRSLADGLRLFLAAKVLQFITGWPVWIAIVAVELGTLIYTCLGGMKAVIWADVIQFAVYIAGATVALWILVGKLPGGWAEIVAAGNSADKFRTFDFALDFTKPFTFWAGLVGGMVLNTATHGADQMMVQRYLSARSQRQAAGALMASGVIILLQFALFLLIGVALYVFYQAFPPAGTRLAPDEAFALFIVRYLPVGVKGLVVAAIFAAAMGTLSGSLNSSSSSMVNDLYRPLSGITDERKLLRVSRALTVIWGLVQMAVALGATRLQDSVVNNALAIASFSTGIVLGLFLLGILTRRVGQEAALAGMIAGISAVSIARFATTLAWPWYALVGSSTVFAVGLAASRVFLGAATTDHSENATASSLKPAS
jgi:SSS family transporter